MAEIRCPLCGKSNAADLEVCQFCQARLKPLQLQADKGSSAAPDTPPQSTPGADQPEDASDWLSSLREPESAPEPVAGEAESDWLAGLRGSIGNGEGWLEFQPGPSDGFETKDEPATPEEDWLGRLAQSEEVEPPERAPADTLDWLEKFEPASRDEFSKASPVEGELPDWLAGFEKDQEIEEGQADDLDWLSTYAARPEPGPFSPEPTSLPASDTEIPFLGEESAESSMEWLAEDKSARPVETQGTPDWLAFKDEISGEELPGESEQPAEEELDWLKELETVFPDTVVEPKTETGEQVSLPFVADESALSDLQPVYDTSVPDWLTAISEPEEAPAEEETEKLQPVALPSWLEAMRPVSPEAGLAGGEVLAGSAESAGPLAGLRAVLPAEPDILHTRKPPAYSARLQVSDLQKSRAELLASLLSAEGEAQPVPGRPIITPQHILRSLIFLVLVIAIAVPLTLGNPRVARPASVPEVSAVGILIERLATHAPVLLVVDYQPAISGEMDAVAGAVLDHLMRRQVFMVFVSSTPIGAYQAEYLVKQAAVSGGYSYQAGENYVNLGYIPGGESGIRGFALAPRQIKPLDLGANRTWDLAGIQAITSAADFDMTLVLTENAEIARAWIEQFQPAMREKPLVMLVSAQVEPYIRPYLEGASGQVQGMVAGVVAGAAYESAWQRAGLASKYWSSYSLSVYAAALMIVLAGAMNLVLIMVQSRTNKFEGGA